MKDGALVVRLVVAALAAHLLVAAEKDTVAGTEIRLALSDQIIYGVNHNDAAAAIGVWVTEVAHSIGVRLARQQSWILPSEQLLAAVRAGSIELVCITPAEYRRVRPYIDAGRVLTDGGDELLVLVREGSGITNLAGLQGRSLVVLESSYTTLADAWLSVSFGEQGLGVPSKVLGKISKSPKPAQVVLPVFFGQADACVAPRRAVETMFDLNPQLAKKLRILHRSPKIVGAFTACRRSYPEQLKSDLFDRLGRASFSPSAKQVMTLFHAVGFSVRDGEVLQSANSLLDAYERRPDGKAAPER